MNNHAKGLLLTATGGLALSLDVPLVRLGEGQMWETLTLRSISTFAVGLILWQIIRFFAPASPALRLGKAAGIAGLFYGLSTIAFLLGVFNTATANVVFIVAFTPMFAALFGWLVAKEKPSSSTWITMGFMVIGVGLIVSSGLAAGEWVGNAAAVATAMLLAGAITVGRSSKADLGLVPLFATIIPILVGMTMMQPLALPSMPHPQWVLLDGLIVLPLAFWCLATGPKYLSGPEVGMFYLLETVLAPIWVWLIFSEEIQLRTFIGGAILVIALIGHALWQVSRQSRIESTTVQSG